jgi:hypothetical protein
VLRALFDPGPGILVLVEEAEAHRSRFLAAWPGSYWGPGSAAS